MTRILRGLTSERLACGCVRGVYETYDGRVVAVIDAPGEGCAQPGHEAGRIGSHGRGSRPRGPTSRKTA